MNNWKAYNILKQVFQILDDSSYPEAEMRKGRGRREIMSMLLNNYFCLIQLSQFFKKNNDWN